MKQQCAKQGQNNNSASRGEGPKILIILGAQIITVVLERVEEGEVEDLVSNIIFRAVTGLKLPNVWSYYLGMLNPYSPHVNRDQLTPDSQQGLNVNS